MSAAPDTRRAPALDGLRVIAAGLVLLSHGRALLIRDAGIDPHRSWPAAFFYGISGLGHQAVIVFFVLSGLLVTDAMLRLAAAGRWSLKGFAAARLVRLWIVLVPALLLGAGIDRLGLALTAAQPYGIPRLGHPAPALGFDVMLGNLLFLQTIAVPVLGSNGALWSLADEAWCYVLAALAFAAWQTRRDPVRVTALLAGAVGVAALLPIAILQGASVWACGAGVALLHHTAPPWLPAWRRRLGWGGALLIGPVLLAARLQAAAEPTLDLALGLALAALLLAGSTRAVTGRGAAWARRGAEMSYSLYLSHLPVLAFLAALTVGPARLPLGAPALAWLGLDLGIALVVGVVVWGLFERHTGRVRAWLAWPALAAVPREATP